MNSKERVFQLALYIIIAKLAFFAVIIGAYYTLPFSDGSLRANFSYNSEQRTFETALKTWDGHHYHSIAESGYVPENMSNAFYPLYPISISSLAPLFSDNSVVAGVVISNIASLLAYLLLYLFFIKESDEQTAFWGTLIMLSYPVAFYTNILYNEAIFLFLAASLFWAASNKYWPIVFISAFLLPLTRPQGLMMALPYAIYVWHSYEWRIKDTLTSPHLLTGLFFVAGFTYYLCILNWEVGNPLAGFAAQKHFISGNSLSNLTDLKGWFYKNFIDTDLSFHGFTNSWIDRGFFIFFLLSLGVIFTQLKNKGMLVCALVLGGLPALAGSFMSYARYTLIIFPIFFALAHLLKSKSITLIIIFIPIQSLFAIRHCLNHWQG